MEQKPSIGRMVHYVNLGDKDGKYPPELQAAIITGVYEDLAPGASKPPQQPGNNSAAEHGLGPANAVGAAVGSLMVDLRVLYRTGEFNMTCVPFSPSYARGHWSWPPRT